ncbi:hypothetical protein [Bacillus phage vB_BanS-Thrax1]|nr:hypothetical protein [Bacillus phage vB_BanS-Thrax1]
MKFSKILAEFSSKVKKDSPQSIAKHAEENGMEKGLATYVGMLRNMSFETPKTNKQKAKDKSKRRMAKKSQRKNR